MEEELLDLPETEELIANEVEMIEGATQAYIAKGNPKPLRVPVTTTLIFKEFGPTAFTLLISLLGAMYISSVRVGVLMEISQINLIARYVATTTGFNIGSAGNAEFIRWTAMAAFEGALLSYGLREGSKMKDQNFSKAAMFMSLAVTVVAGILAGLQLDNNLPALQGFLSTTFSVLSGVGSPVVVIFAAQNVGFLLREILGMNKAHDLEWISEMNKWKIGFDTYFPIYTNQVFGQERRKTKLHKIIDENTPPPSHPIPSRSGSALEDIRAYLKRSILMPSQIGEGPEFRMKPSVLADHLKLNAQGRKNIHTYLVRLRKLERENKF